MRQVLSEFAVKIMAVQKSQIRLSVTCRPWTKTLFFPLMRSSMTDWNQSHYCDDRVIVIVTNSKLVKKHLFHFCLRRQARRKQFDIVPANPFRSSSHHPRVLPFPSLGWRRGVVVSGVRRINAVNARRARLLPGWVTVFGRVYRLGM